MSKRKSSIQRGHRAAKRPAQRKQHLYLVLDDWERGYSVRKVDVDAFDSDADSYSDPRPTLFTEPPVTRMETLHARSWSFVAHGTKIFAMQPTEASPAIPAFDIDTLGMAICPWPSSRGDYGRPLLASVAGKLFLFLYPRTDYLGDPPPHNSKVPWSWTTINKPLPFKVSVVTSYTVHPDGRTLFVSAVEQGTFSFDTERLEWARHGDWLLPFTGQAYFDTELEAWVGLCGQNDGAGYLCSCDIIAPVAAESTSPPSWKLGKDKLFDTTSALHLGATLVYMGNSKFCLVESLMHKDDEHKRHHPGINRYCTPWRRCVLCMTTFGLKYNKAGELRIMSQRARACKMFKLAHDLGDPSLDPVAFWI